MEAASTTLQRDAARARLERMLREGELPGAQYVAVSARETLLDLQVGVADVATGEPLRRETLQMAYSLTKAVTTIAVMQLVDAGKLELDAALSGSWPDHPYGSEVTLRSLLAHTSGVPNPLPLAWFALEGEPLDREERLRDTLKRSPKRSGVPGAAYGYSNVGYWLLEKAIEAASGQDFASYVEQAIFAPLGLGGGAIAFDLPLASISATGHARRFTLMNLVLHALTPARYWVAPHRGWSRTARVRSIGLGYGGMFASAAALAPLLQDLLRLQPELLSRRARAEMFSAQRTRRGKIVGALGWVSGELGGVRYLGKQGGGLGFHGNLRLYPECDLATVLLCNSTEIAPGPIDARSDALDAALIGPDTLEITAHSAAAAKHQLW
jgi:D-alanyl-D-alanine carboxypeptidase